MIKKNIGSFICLFSEEVHYNPSDIVYNTNCQFRSFGYPLGPRPPKASSTFPRIARSPGVERPEVPVAAKVNFALRARYFDECKIQPTAGAFLDPEGQEEERQQQVQVE